MLLYVHHKILLVTFLDKVYVIATFSIPRMTEQEFSTASVAND